MGDNVQRTSRSSRREFVKGTAAGAIGTLTAARAARAAEQRPAAQSAGATCGFGKIVVFPADTKTVGGITMMKDVEARFLYCRDGQQQWMLVAYDLPCKFRKTCLKLQQAIAKATGIPVAAVWTHDTQVHGVGAQGPSFDSEICEQINVKMFGKPIAEAKQRGAEAEALYQQLIERSVATARETVARAEEAELSYAIVDLGTKWNICREQYVPGWGGVTVWTDWRIDDQGRSWGPTFVGGAIPERILRRQPSSTIYFDRPNDPQAALLVFRSKKTGKVMGHLSRFTGHADVVLGATTVPDWPAYLRQALEAELGGVGVAVCGPCGDSATKYDRTKNAVEECTRVAQGVAGECLKAFKTKPSGWEPLRLHSPVSESVDLPMRDTIPHNLGELLAPDGPHAQRVKQCREALQKARKESAPEFWIKQLQEDSAHLSVMNKLCLAWPGLSEEEMAKGAVKVELSAVRLNDLVLAGWAGEGMLDTTNWLKAQSFGNKLITVDQINGYLAYITTRQQYDLKAYTYWCSIMSRDAEPLLREHGLKVIRQAWEV